MGGEATPSGQPDLGRIRDYYDQTWFDYRLLWLRPQNRAIHFGYWDVGTRGHSASLLNMNRALAGRIGVRTGQRVLDAGCGVGGSSIWLAQTYGVEVVGITPVASQIDRARRYAEEQGVADRVSFAQQDYTQTALPAASFDVVWAMESVCHAPDKRLFLAEARRLLRPGGRLGMVEYLRAARPLAAAGESLLQSWLSGWAIPDLATAGEFQQWLGEAGFRDVVVENIGAQVQPSLRRLFQLALVLGPVAWALHRVGLRSATAQGNLRGARDQYRAVRRGLWHEAILTATAAPVET
jgi:cyclopropane fatty-acyl-phospholipid synthase-like methyltransferase